MSSLGNFGTTTNKTITTKEVAKILKINSEVISYLRKFEGLPYFKRKKYILFNEAEVVRWRNQRLLADSKEVVNLKKYYYKIGLCRFCTYDEFKEQTQKSVFMDGDYVIQYLPRQNVWGSIKDIVGDIVTSYWCEKKPHCEKCGTILHTTLEAKLCSKCKSKGTS